MNQTEKTVLDLLGRALFGARTRLPENSDFSALYREAQVQTVLPILYGSLYEEEKARMTADEKLKWDKALFAQIIKNEQLLYEQDCIVKIMEEGAVSFAVLKGSSSAMYYPDPSSRVMGDIDILVEPADQLRAVMLLQEKLGYGEVLEEEHHCHYTIQKGKITVEVHREPNGLFFNENEKTGERLRMFFATAVAERRKAESIYVLSDIHQALVLIIHKLEHFLSGGLGLRQLCDWAVFVNARMDACLWSALQEKLESFGLLTFAEVITRVCIDYLSLPEEKAPWAVCDSALSTEIMERIISEGNFGRKEKKGYGQVLFTNAYSPNRISSFFKVLGATCRKHWKPCDKHPILMPIAPFVVYCKYLKLRAQGKRAKLYPVSLYKEAGTKQRLYRELKPFVLEENEEKASFENDN